MKMQFSYEIVTIEHLQKMNLLFIGSLTGLFLTCCTPKVKNDTIMQNEPTLPIDSVETFQEIGFFGPIKKDKWTDFLQAVQNNIFHSREESGNLSFTLYQPENGKLEPIWFERFVSKEAHNFHKEQDHFKNAIQVIQESLEGEASSINLKLIDKIPVTIPVQNHNTKAFCHILILFEIEPKKRNEFLTIIHKLVVEARKSPGNLEANIYEFANESNKFVFLEGWENTAASNTFKNQEGMQNLNTALRKTFATHKKDAVWILKDISLEN